MRTLRPILVTALLIVSLFGASCGARNAAPPGAVATTHGAPSASAAPAASASGSGSASDTVTTFGKPAPTVVGPDGGIVYVPNGPTVWIPPGALKTPQTITITPVPSPPPVADATAVGPRYVFGPEGLQFDEPVTLTLEYDPKRLPPKKRAPSVRVFTGAASSAKGEELPTTLLDATHVKVRTTHFSWYEPSVPLRDLDPFEGPYYQLDVFDRASINRRGYDASSSLAHAQQAPGVNDADMPDPGNWDWPDVPYDTGWNQELCGVPFLWQNRTQNLLSDEAGAPIYDAKGERQSGATGDAIVFVLDKPRRATHVEMLVTSVMGHVSLVGQTLGRVEVTYEGETKDKDGPTEKIDLVLGKNLRNNHYFLPTDPAMRLPEAQFTDFVHDVSDAKNVCKFATKVDRVQSAHYEIDRVRLPLSHEAVHARRRVKKIVIRNVPHAVLLPGIANTGIPVVQRVQYTGLQIWGVTVAKEVPIIVVPGIMGTSLSEDGLSGVLHEPWLGSLVSLPWTMETSLAAMGFDAQVHPVGPALQKCELVGLAKYQSGPLDFFSGILSFMRDSMGYRLAKSELEPHEGRCWKMPAPPDPKDDCTLREDLYTFPYDWRQKTDDVAKELGKLVDSIKARTGAEKVDIVAHSLGGVVSRIYLANGGAANVDTYITLGTPFYGAPKVFGMTRYGQVLLPLPTYKDAQRRGFKHLSRNMPGVYMLLPSQAFVDAAGPYFTYDATDVPGAQGTMDYATMTNWLSTAPCSTDWYLPIHPVFGCVGPIKYYNADLVAWAEKVHAQIDHWDDASDDAPWKYAIIGTGHPTLAAMAEHERPERGFTEKGWRCEDGDGSVAPASALGFPRSVRKYVYVKAEHATMPDEPAIQKQIQLFIPGIEEVAPGASEQHKGDGPVSDCDPEDATK